MDLAINYSHEIIPDILEGTIGYNVYYFPDRAFWGTNFSGEFYTKLTLTSIPYIRPNVTYSRFNSAAHQLRGTFIDIRVDTVTLPVYKGNSVNVGLRPYVALGVDSNLIGDGTDWTALTMGLVIPVNVGKRVIFSVNGNYAFPINGQSPSPSFHSDLGKVGFWGGASVSVRF